jgi:O-antigen ligase
VALLGITYSNAPLAVSSYGFRKYAYFLLFILLLPYFYYDKKSASLLLGSFVIGSLLFFLYGILSHQDTYHMNPIAVSLFFALLLLWTQLTLYCTSKQKIIRICFIGVLCYHLLYINTEKTGFVVFAIEYSLIVLLFLKKYFLRSLLSTLLVGLIVICAYKKPTNLLIRVQRFAHSFDASSSERLEMARQCLILVKQKPFIGHGTCSFGQSLIRHDWSYIGETATAACERRAQPHNEWLHVCTQWGLLGMVVFMYWFSYSFYYGWKHRHDFYGQALIALNGAYLIAGCCDSVFFAASYRFAYIFLFCAIVAKLAGKELKEVR